MYTTGIKAFEKWLDKAGHFYRIGLLTKEELVFFKTVQKSKRKSRSEIKRREDFVYEGGTK